MSDKYYLQDASGYVGNCMLWWQDGGGYCCDITKAEVFSKEDAIRQNESRETDIPWPKDYIDKRMKSIVDMQYVNSKDALNKTGIKLNKPKKQRKEQFRCGYCGKFLRMDQYYGDCPHCGENNMP